MKVLWLPLHEPKPSGMTCKLKLFFGDVKLTLTLILQDPSVFANVHRINELGQT